MESCLQLASAHAIVLGFVLLAKRLSKYSPERRRATVVIDRSFFLARQTCQCQFVLDHLFIPRIVLSF